MHHEHGLPRHHRSHMSAGPARNSGGLSVAVVDILSGG